MPRFMNWVSSYWDLLQRSAVISTMPEAYEWMYADSIEPLPDDGPDDAELPVVQPNDNAGGGDLADM